MSKPSRLFQFRLNTNKQPKIRFNLPEDGEEHYEDEDYYDEFDPELSKNLHNAFAPACCNTSLRLHTFFISSLLCLEATRVVFICVLSQSRLNSL